MALEGNGWEAHAITDTIAAAAFDETIWHKMKIYLNQFKKMEPTPSQKATFCQETLPVAVENALCFFL